MTRCYFVRHARTAWNHQDRLQGHSDLPLDAVGEAQAKCVGAFFAPRTLRGIFTSSLARSRQTAEAIAAGTTQETDPVIVPELAEMHLGAWEGLTPLEIDERFAGAYQQWKRKPSSVTIPSAEPHEAFRVRVRRAVAELRTALGEGDYAVVSHGGVIAAVLADTLGADYDLVIRRLRLDNGGITALEFGSGVPHVLCINWTAHLDRSPADGEPVPALQR